MSKYELCPECKTEGSGTQPKKCLLEKALESYLGAPDGQSGERMGNIAVVMEKASQRGCPKLVPFIKNIMKSGVNEISKENQGKKPQARAK